MNYVLTYITTANRDEATAIGNALVSEKLAACVNIVDGMTSIYRWKGEICTDNETVLLAKTTEENFTRLSNRVKELHSYECPCIVSIPITNGRAEYLNWLAEQVR